MNSMLHDSLTFTISAYNTSTGAWDIKFSNKTTTDQVLKTALDKGTNATFYTSNRSEKVKLSLAFSNSNYIGAFAFYLRCNDSTYSGGITATCTVGSSTVTTTNVSTWGSWWICPVYSKYPTSMELILNTTAANAIIILSGFRLMIFNPTQPRFPAKAHEAYVADTLSTARTINGTSFNGSANITTANWGTARNIYIADSDGSNAGTAVSVNGSGNVTLKLPSTIKASLSGNATSATSATKLTTSAGSATQPVYFSDGKPVACTYSLNKTVPSDAVFTDKQILSVGTRGSVGQSTTSNGETAINILDGPGFAATSSVLIQGDGAVLVSSDASDNITIRSRGNFDYLDIGESSFQEFITLYDDNEEYHHYIGITTDGRPLPGLSLVQEPVDSTTLKRVELDIGLNHLQFDSGEPGNRTCHFNVSTDGAFSIGSTSSDSGLHTETTGTSDYSILKFRTNYVPLAASNSVGLYDQPVYLQDGVLQAFSSTIGGPQNSNTSFQPVYLGSGRVTGASTTVGAYNKPVYMSSGVITPCTFTSGSSSKPAYLSNGAFYNCSGNTISQAYSSGKTVTFSGTPLFYVVGYYFSNGYGGIETKVCPANFSSSSTETSAYSIWRRGPDGGASGGVRFYFTRSGTTTTLTQTGTTGSATITFKFLVAYYYAY